MSLGIASRSETWLVQPMLQGCPGNSWTCEGVPEDLEVRRSVDGDEDACRLLWCVPPTEYSWPNHAYFGLFADH